MSIHEKKYKCTICDIYSTDSFKSIRAHIIEKHGDFICFKCKKKINIKHLNRHEIDHIKNDISKGSMSKKDIITTPCCFCNKSRDDIGYHFCTKNLFLSSFIKNIPIKSRNGKLNYILTKKLLDPYTKVTYNILKTEQGKNKYIQEKKSLIDETDDVFISLFDSKLIDKQENKLRSMKKNLFNPKIKSTLNYDSDA